VGSKPTKDKWDIEQLQLVTAVSLRLADRGLICGIEAHQGQVGHCNITATTCSVSSIHFIQDALYLRYTTHPLEQSRTG
jgi:hypothetical protein